MDRKSLSALAWYQALILLLCFTVANLIPTLIAPGLLLVQISLHTSVSAVQFSRSSHFIAFSLSGPIFGYFADR